MSLLKKNWDEHFNILTIAFLFSLFLSSSIYGAINLTTEEQLWLKQHPILRHAPDTDYIPFEFKNNQGHIVGIAPDLLAHLEKILKIRIESISTSSWNESLEKIKSGKADLLTVATKTPEREKFLNFTSPYMIFSDLILTKKELKGPLNLSFFKGKKIAAIRGWAINEMVLRDYPEIQLVWMATVNEALTSLSLGEVDAFLLNRATAGHWIGQLKINNLHSVGEAPFSYQLSIATRKDWPLLNQIISKALNEISKEKFKQLQNHWISLEDEPESFKANDHFRLIFGIFSLVFFLSVGAAFFYWQKYSTRIFKDQNLNYYKLSSNYSTDKFKFQGWRKSAVESTHFLVLFIGIGITFFLYQSTIKEYENDFRDKFEYESRIIINKIILRMDSYEQILRGVRGHFSSSKSVSRETFHQYVNELNLEQKYPGIQGVGFSLVVPSEEREKHISKIKQEGFPNYTLWPKDPKRELYTSIIYIEPFKDRNLRAFGYDMYSEDIRKEAMDRARNFGVAALSGAVKLVQENNENIQTGVLLYLPVYKKNSRAFTLDERQNNILGWVYSPFRMNDLMDGILGERNNGFELRIFDGDEENNSKILLNTNPYKDININDSKTFLNTLFYKQTIWIAGHPWTIKILSKISLEEIVQSKHSILFLIMGFLITGMMTFIIWQMVQWQNWGINLATLMTLDFRRSEQKMREITSTISDGIYLIDKNKTISYINEAALKMLGLNSDEVLGKNSCQFYQQLINQQYDLYKQQEKQGLCPICQELKRNKVIKEASKTFWCKDGSQVKVALNISIIVRLEKWEGTLVVFRDITLQENIQKQLQSAKDLAEQSSKFKSNFISVISHEIRTPMNAVLGMTTLLQETSLCHEQKEMVGIIANSGQNLLVILNDILDYSKIEAGKLKFENHPFDFKYVIENIINLLIPSAKKKGIDLQVHYPSDIPMVFVGDTTRISQILVNLLSNAIKFSENTPVITEISFTKTTALTSYEIHFAIKDFGIGIASEDQVNLFHPFFQANSSISTKYGGTGLGLAICAHLIKLMKGSIWVESELGKGSIFHFTLTLQKGDETCLITNRDKITFNKDLAKNYPLRILVAEDNMINQRIVKGFLQAFGYNPDISSNGKEVIEALERKDYHLIFMDIQMPEMDGIETTKQIRNKWPNKNIKIVAMTANMMSVDLQKYLNSGMNAYIGKPLMVSDFQYILENCSTLEFPSQISLNEVVSEKNQIDFKLIDLPKMMLNYNNNKKLIQELINIFYTQYSSCLNKIQQAIHNRNPEGLEHSAHFLKGSVGCFFATSLKNKLYALEEMGRTNQLEDAFEIYQQVLKEMEDLKKELEILKLIIT